MAPDGMNFTLDTLLDLTVNLIPVGILAAMDLFFIVFNPWNWDLWYVFWMHFLTLFPLGILLILTYVSGRVIQRDEAELRERGAVEAADD